MRIVLAVLLLVHAAIHLLGFVKPWKLAAVPQLSGRTLVPLPDGAMRVVGVAWLVAALLLGAAAVMLLVGSAAWWKVALAGMVLSQVLIVLQWSDAKAGTVPNAMVGVAVLVAAASASFGAASEAQAHALFARAGSASVVTVAELEGLPPPIKRWMRASGVVGHERAETVRLLQRGEMRTSPDGAWMPTEAEQYFTTAEPGFVWKADVTMARALPIAGRDSYQGGHGRMLIKAASLVPVVDATGPKIDQGSLLRFLGEMMWFPSAALRPYIRWEPVDDTEARATMTWEGVTASALVAIDERGRPVRFSAERYRGSGDDATLDRWVVPCTEWKVVRGIEIPVRGEVTWRLASGDFTYYRWEILDVEQNVRALYGDPAPGGGEALRPRALVTRLP